MSNEQIMNFQEELKKLKEQNEKCERLAKKLKKMENNIIKKYFPKNLIKKFVTTENDNVFTFIVGFNDDAIQIFYSTIIGDGTIEILPEYFKLWKTPEDVNSYFNRLIAIEELKIKDKKEKQIIEDYIEYNKLKRKLIKDVGKDFDLKLEKYK